MVTQACSAAAKGFLFTAAKAAQMAVAVQPRPVTRTPSGKCWAMAACMAAYGIVAQCVGWALISRGLRDTRVSLAGLILLLQPALAYVWDLVFFAKPAGVAEVCGVAATLAGIALGARRR